MRLIQLDSRVSQENRKNSDLSGITKYAQVNHSGLLCVERETHCFSCKKKSEIKEVWAGSPSMRGVLKGAAFGCKYVTNDRKATSASPKKSSNYLEKKCQSSE